MILPSSPQLAPDRFAASHSMMGAPPSIAIFFRFPAAQKPTQTPSGEKNGKRAPVVSWSSTTSSRSSRRVASRVDPSSPLTTNTRRVPSGEITTSVPTSDPSIPRAARALKDGAGEHPLHLFERLIVRNSLHRQALKSYGSSSTLPPFPNPANSLNRLRTCGAVLPSDEANLHLEAHGSARAEAPSPPMATKLPSL
jgi:hypothetical protein